MRTDVPITTQQAQQRYADLLSAIGATSERPDRRSRRREGRRTAQRYAWWRRLRLA
jgi:hypothetical protein